jgi:DHA1 family bicyclomycin/chloramphenicol resistance-like MFS transporter
MTMGQVARYRLLVLLSLAAALQGLASTSYTQVLLDVKHDFHSAWWLVASTVSLFSLATALARLAVGPLVQRWGEGRLVLPSLFLFGVGSLIGAGAPSVQVLVLGITVQALGIAPVSIITSSLLAQRYGGADRGRMLGLSQTISWVGPMLGPLLGSYASVLVGWRAIFFVHACLTFPLALGLLLVEEELNGAKEPYLDQTVKLKREGSRWSAHLLAISGLGAVHFFVLFTVQALLPVVVRTHLGLDARYAGWISLLLSVVSMLLFPWGGRLADRIGSHRTTVWGALVLGGAVLILTLAMMLQTGGGALLMLGVFALGAASGITLPAHLTEVVDRFSENRTGALGTYKLLQYLGGSAGPALLGGLLPVLAPGAILALVGAIGGGVAVAGARVLKRTRPDPRAYPWLQSTPLYRQRRGHPVRPWYY